MEHEPISACRRVNLLIDRETVQAARELGSDPSRTVEHGLAHELKATGRRRWLERNREAIGCWNEWYERSGDPPAHLQPLR